MSKRKKTVLMLLRGGMSQSDVAAVMRCSKRDVSAAKRAIVDYALTVDAVEAMTEAEVELLVAPPKPPKEKNPSYLQPDMDAYIERKARNKRLPVKLMWYEYCRNAERQDLEAYCYQTFCEMFAEAEDRSDARKRFDHLPGEKAYIDWAGDVAWITDRITGKKFKVYVLVVCLPCSCKFFAEGFMDMKRESWLRGHADAFEHFGGAPQMLIPDNCATATDRSPRYVTLVNETYERFAEHYGAAVVPARVRKPRDKSLAEGTVNLVTQWAIAPASEEVFHTLDEFNDYLAERVGWLNARPFSEREGSRDSAYEEKERGHMLPLPPTRFETYRPAKAVVKPDYHVRIDYMHYSVPHRLIGEECDIRLYQSRVVVSCKGEVVAEHPRKTGRKGQYSTDPSHMPPNHQMTDSPWSRGRFESWAARVGPATAEAVRRMMDSKPIIQQSFVACRNVLGLSKAYAPDLLERACAEIVAVDAAVPSYTAVKNRILAIRAADAKARAEGRPPTVPREDEELIDRAKNAGRVSGAAAWKRKGGDGGC